MKDNEIFRGWTTFHKGIDGKALELSFKDHLQYSLSKHPAFATTHDLFLALALSARDRLIEGWIRTQQLYHEQDVKRIYYLSAEYLMGRALINNLINLDLYDPARALCARLGVELADLAEEEPDAGLGNGGLGRLAACFVESMATLELPAVAYGIRYEYGIFEQVIQRLAQQERPDCWLERGNPWEIARPEKSYRVQFYGRTEHHRGEDGRLEVRWLDTRDVVGMAYDTPIDGYDNLTVNTLRLWSSKATHEFDLEYFNHGDYLKAVEEKNLSENLSKVLYPRDEFPAGKDLRLQQQYFFVSCSLQDIVQRYRKDHDTFDAFPDKAAIQLNDTHPSLAVAELMRLLMDEHHLGWDEAWDLTRRSCAYTNHTLLAEALERWRASRLGRLLPRHLEIIYEINRRFLEEVSEAYPGDADRLRRMSLVEEGDEKKIRMAHLAIVGSHSVNGVSALHTELLKDKQLPDFHELYPDKFNNKTNGVTPRRWLLAANEPLSGLITEHLGPTWAKDLETLTRLEPLAEDVAFRRAYRQAKRRGKERLVGHCQELTGITLDPDSIFDVQVKRIHEYKRQTLNLLHVVTHWLALKNDPHADAPPRSVLFGGKAAPGYVAAKRIIQLICHVAETVNRDPITRDRLQVVFLPNYRVSLAELLFPAADVSEQISTAGYEASGTGNMKFMCNGALTLGTLDGANVEIREEVGDDNIFIFGLDAEEVAALQPHYQGVEYLDSAPGLAEAVDLIRNGFFSPEEPGLFHSLVDTWLYYDPYLVLADFADYHRAQRDVDRTFRDADAWSRKALLNIAHCGRFSSDRTISDYNRDIWHAAPLTVDRG
ncbi:MAG: glycogen/starch/alpha-glucan phosphorylase [bacterium]